MTAIFAKLTLALTAPGLVGLIALAVFLVVYALRKKFGLKWEKYAAIVAPDLDAEMSVGRVLLSKLFQALPGTLLAAGFGALTSGASLGPTLLAALGGLLASFGHEMLKGFPWVSYLGRTGLPGPAIPKAPKLPTGVATLAICLSLLGCASLNSPTCTAADKAAIEAHYSESVAIKCSAYGSLAECPDYPDLKAERAKEEIPCRR